MVFNGVILNNSSSVTSMKSALKATLKLPGVFIGVVNSKISGGRMEGLGFCTPVFDVITHLKLNGK